MYLKSFTLNNFRKFRSSDNKVLFAHKKLKEENEDIDISTATTLIIGKNNVGKTSIINALEKLEGKSKKFKATDFNYSYLSELLNDYEESIEQNRDIKLPEMTFTLKIQLDDSDDIISNVAPLLLLENTESATVSIKVELKEAEEFKNKVKELIKKDKETQFKLLLTAIEEVELITSYYNMENNLITDFKLKDLLEVKSIAANTINQPDSLTKAFNKIIDFKYKKNQKENINPDSNIASAIDEINKTFTEKFQKNYTKDVNESLGKIEPADKLEIKLTSDLTHDKLLNNILIYEYVEQGLTIPESQYGLGYTNMVMIIAEIIDYIERSPEDAFSSKLNFISIEEPETYMHPQMQELFIRNINKAIEQLFESKKRMLIVKLLLQHIHHIY